MSHAGQFDRIGFTRESKWKRRWVGNGTGWYGDDRRLGRRHGYVARHVGTGTLGTAGVAITAGTRLEREIERPILQSGNFFPSG